MCTPQEKDFLIIEVFYGGSHKELVINFATELSSYDIKCDVITMTPKKWHWRARTSALYLSTVIPKNQNYKVLFCTSMLPLAELIALRPDLSGALKVVYFHENQLCYPIKHVKQRDFQYGYNEILSCIVADKVFFNSQYNLTSFLINISKHLKLQPDYVTNPVPEQVEDKCSVIYFPINIRDIDRHLKGSGHNKQETATSHENHLHIVWPHRWEEDKGPDVLENALTLLKQQKLNFKISVLGQSFHEVPESLKKIEETFKDYILHFGYVPNKSDYYRILRNADVVLSTAAHEFFGVSVMEAVYCGCVPVLPKKLSYTELYDGNTAHFYETLEELLQIVTEMCEKKEKGLFTRKDQSHIAKRYESRSWCNRLMNTINIELENRSLPRISDRY